jgi:hypothetical protein
MVVVFGIRNLNAKARPRFRFVQCQCHPSLVKAPPVLSLFPSSTILIPAVGIQRSITIVIIIIIIIRTFRVLRLRVQMWPLVQHSTTTAVVILRVGAARWRRRGSGGAAVGPTGGAAS